MHSSDPSDPRDALAEDLREYAVHVRADRLDHVDRLLEHMPNLRNLPAVAALGAGQKGEDQLKAIRRAILRAVDGLDPRYKPAARELLGLTEGSREKSWMARQETAAKLCGMGPDYFRKNMRKSLLRAIADHLASAPTKQARARARREGAEAKRRRGKEAHTPPKIRSVRGVTAFEDQYEIEEPLRRYIEEAKPESATLLEYSSYTVGSILRSLRDAGCNVRLLMSHPEPIPHPGTGMCPAAPTKIQSDRIKVAITNLREVKFRGHQGLEVRFYQTPPSLRGRRIGDYVIVGWYTYRDDHEKPIDDPAQLAVWGHDNVVIVGDVRTKEGAKLASWFDREFDRLWHHRRTIPEESLTGNHSSDGDTPSPG